MAAGTLVGGAMPLKPAADAVTLLASITDTATNAGAAAVLLPRVNNGFCFQLNVTAAAAAVGDTLDVFIQTSFDGTTYTDVVHFTQALGNGGAKRFITKTCCALTQAEYENASALAVSSVRNMFGDLYRVRYAIVDGGAHGQSFTFSVVAMPI